MGWQHRDYASECIHVSRPRHPFHGSGMSALSVTSVIIIANIVVALLAFSGGQIGKWLFNIGVMQTHAVVHGQVWRLFTATYLHANFSHIFFNMLALYFLGPALERVWGRRQFFLVYTLGGVIGNVLLTLAGLIGWIDPKIPALGASGSVLSLLGAAAVLFPNAQVYVYFLFPIRIRTCVIIYGIWYVYNVFQKGSNYGGDLCHIGGLILGLWWAYSGGFSLAGRHRRALNPSSLAAKLASIFRRGEQRSGQGAWQERMRQRRADDETIDRILGKVSQHGLNSLSPAEKRALREASERRRAEQQRLENIDRD